MPTTTGLRRILPTPGRPGTGTGGVLRRWPLHPGWPHAALAVGFMAVFTLLTVARYQRFSDPSWDLGIFVQVARGYASGHIPTVTIKGEGFKILGDHWSPILAVLGPLWRLWPSPVMLLVLQAGLFSWSAAIVSDTAAHFLGRTRGLLIGLAYGLSWGLQRALDFEFHEIAFAVPLLAVVGRQVLFKQWSRAAWWSLPLLLVKEDLGLTVAAVGLVLLVNRRWRLGPALVVLGIASTACAVWWWIPHFNTAGHFDYWSKMPGHRGEHDVRALMFDLVTRHTVWTTLGWTLGATAFLCLRSPLLLMAAPTLLWRFASANVVYWGRDWHYSAVVMPVVFLAAVDGLTRLAASGRPWLEAWARNAVPAVVGIAVACTAAAPLPVADAVDPVTYQGGPRAAEMRAALKAVPPGVTVEAASRAVAHLAARNQVYWVGGSQLRPPQYMVVEAGDDAPMDAPAYGRAFHATATYEVVFQRGRVSVIRLVG
jgi:uncharacterized membrane protein